MTGPHPTGDQLAAYAEDTLGPVARAEVADHLATCHQCRREVQDLERFLALDQDDELLADADWPRAEQALEVGWQRRHQTSWWRGAARRRIWVPAAAAAAAVLLLVVNLSRIMDEPPRGVPVRGGEETVITLDEPVGEVSACPDRFAWTTDDTDAAFVLEIFTAELQPVATVEGLDHAHWTTDAAFCDTLETGRRYLWSVQSLHDGEVTARSAAQWFQITGEVAPAP